MNSYILLLLFLLLLIYIAYAKLNNNVIIIQSEGKGYEWGGIKLKHIFIILLPKGSQPAIPSLLLGEYTSQ